MENVKNNLDINSPFSLSYCYDEVYRVLDRVGRREVIS